MIRMPQSVWRSASASCWIVAWDLSSSVTPNHMGAVVRTVSSSTRRFCWSRAKANAFFSGDQKV